MTDTNLNIPFLPKPTGYQFKDLEGQVFGRLTVFQYVEQRKRRAYWLCQCLCGKQVIVGGKYLLNGHTVSCGCQKREFWMIHGQGGAKEKRSAAYRTWNHMMMRCTNPHNPQFSDYGGRGITVCARWRKFEHFFADMGERPDGLSLDRIDNNQGYYKENCRWATAKEQANNMRCNRHYTFEGRTQRLELWAMELGIKANTLRNRLHKGWGVTRSFTEPVSHRKGARRALV